MRRAMVVGVLMGLILSFLSWIATLFANAFPGAWVANMGAVVQWISVAGWIWLGWRLGSAGGTGLSGAVSGSASGLVVGLLVGVPQALFLQGTGVPLPAGGKSVMAMGAVLSTLFLAAVLGALGGLLGRANRRMRSVGTDDPKGDLK